ncbi:MAG: hypothetical protein MRZ79_27235 [Bacteroidia bacterium]|nr:hypothetical protein [Bacteroidia bacterium]
MKKNALVLLLLFLFVAGMNIPPISDSLADAPTQSSTVEPAPQATPFDVMTQVLTHQRCLNCHPAGDRPRQGDESRVHSFNIQRGEDGHGMLNAQCSSCHQSENNNFSGVPGAPHWHLAPKSMAWEGLNRIEIVQVMLDKGKNGGRSLEEIEKHLTEDPLVLWAFDPGVNNEGLPREKPPVSKEEFIKAVKQWVAEGAVIPAK